MKKILIVLALFNALNTYSMDKKERKPLRNRRIPDCRDQKKIPSTEELETLASKKKEYALLKARRNLNYPSYPQPVKKTLSDQEVEILAAQKKAAHAKQLKKEICVGLSCYLCCSTATIASYHAGAYALGQLKNAATNYFFNTTKN